MRKFISALGALFVFFGLILGAAVLMVGDLAGMGDIEASVVSLFGSWSVFALVLIVVGSVMVSGFRSLIKMAILAVGIYLINLGLTYVLTMMSYGTDYLIVLSILVGLIILPPFLRRI